MVMRVAGLGSVGLVRIDRHDAWAWTPATSARRRRPSRVDRIRRTYGFDDVSLAPGTATVEPADVDTSRRDRRPAPAHPHPRRGHGRRRRRPLRRRSSAAWAGSRCSTSRASRRATRTRTPSSRASPTRRPDDLPATLSPRRTQPPIREELVALRIAELHAAGSPAVVAATPAAARRWGPFCAEHGADLFLVQSQVSSAQHLATRLRAPRAARVHAPDGHPGRGRQHDLLRRRRPADGRRASRPSSWASGPGAACTTREVLGHRRAAGDRHRGRGRGARRPLRRDRPLRAGRRRRRHAPRWRAGQGDRRRRGRAHARARRSRAPRRRPGGARTGAWPRPRPRCRAAPASRSARSARWSGSCSARRASPTARRTSSGALRQSMAALGAPRHPRHAAGRDGLRAGRRGRGQVLAAEATPG